MATHHGAERRHLTILLDALHRAAQRIEDLPPQPADVDEDSANEAAWQIERALRALTALIGLLDARAALSTDSEGNPQRSGGAAARREAQ